MTRAEKNMEEIQDQLRRWAKKTGKDYPHQLESTLRHAINQLDPSALAHASENVVATLTGNQKMARKARRSVEKSLESARRKLGGRAPRPGRKVLVGGAAAVLICVTATVIWKAVRSSQTDSMMESARENDQESSGTRTDPDLSN